MFTKPEPVGRWSDLATRLDDGVLIRWSRREPALAGIRNTRDLVRAWNAPDRADAVGDALVRLAAAGGDADDDALLVLLHLLSGVVFQLSRRLADLSPAITLLVVSELTFQIRSYRRPVGTGRVVAYLARNTRRALLSEVRRTDRHHPDRAEEPVAPRQLIEVVDSMMSVPAVDDIGEPDLGDLISWAAVAGADVDDLSLLVESEQARGCRGIGADAGVARGHGIARRTLLRRRQRALSVLRRVAPEYLRAVA